jgi:2-dehydro-3-deoxyphosphooctonate aldolase (KDO 8-P synthase)
MNEQNLVSAGSVTFGNDQPLRLIAGPCAMESRAHAIDVAGVLMETCSQLNLELVFKTSFDKANRTSADGPRGVGIDEALMAFADIRDNFNMPVLTDVHTAEQCGVLERSGVVDVLQIPAFLCRQTDLLLAAGKTGLAINVKKGQFLAPWDMANVVAKIQSTGNDKVMVCERGTSFGYNTLVSDMRALPVLVGTGCPVIFDATHSVQQPGGQGASSGGQREFAPILARAAVSIGVAGVFMETHENPDEGLSDGPNMIPLKQLPSILKTLIEFDLLAKEHPVSI